MRQISLSIAALCLFAAPALATMEMAIQGGMTPPPPPVADAVKNLKGKVMESVTSGGYTYINLQQDKETKWVAIPQASVKTGETIEVLPGMEMGEHYSKTLKRTFPNIIFSGGLAGDRPKEDKETTARKQSAHASVGLDTAKDGGGDALAANLKIDKATGDNAYTVAEAITQSKKLANQRIKVRGKIIKVAKGILGTNWYHLRDGSGEAAKKTNNLVVTGRTEMMLGDTVTATGTLHVNKDFGSGYFYEVIMEDTMFAP